MVPTPKTSFMKVIAFFVHAFMIYVCFYLMYEPDDEELKISKTEKQAVKVKKEK